MSFWRKPSVPEIDAVILHGKMKEEKPPRLLDVRETEEHEEGVIPGAILIPMGQLGDKLKQVAPDEMEEIVVYCRSGNRSLYSTEQLRHAGYTNVASLQGGILGWWRQGYEIAEPKP
ncbi:MAG: rhodanese-like domain-containing protein [bacterium]|nr:rhodanese-like domain-containing protein [bacterium]